MSKRPTCPCRLATMTLLSGALLLGAAHSKVQAQLGTLTFALDSTSTVSTNICANNNDWSGETLVKTYGAPTAGSCNASLVPANWAQSNSLLIQGGLLDASGRAPIYVSSAAVYSASLSSAAPGCGSNNCKMCLHIDDDTSSTDGAVDCDGGTNYDVRTYIDSNTAASPGKGVAPSYTVGTGAGLGGGMPQGNALLRTRGRVRRENGGSCPRPGSVAWSTVQVNWGADYTGYLTTGQAMAVVMNGLGCGTNCPASGTYTARLPHNVPDGTPLDCANWTQPAGSSNAALLGAAGVLGEWFGPASGGTGDLAQVSRLAGEVFPSHTGTMTPTGTVTPTATLTPTPTGTDTSTVTSTIPDTPAATTSPTATDPATWTHTVTETPTATPATTATPTITPTPTIFAGGTLLYYGSGAPIPGVTLGGRPSVLDPNDALAAVSDAGGSFVMGGIPTGPWALVPHQEETRARIAPGLSSLDATVVQEEVVGLRTFSSLERLACDTTGNGAVSSLDAVRIQEFMVMWRDHMPVSALCGSDWVFWPSPGSPGSPVPPTLAPCGLGAVEYSSLTGSAAGQDFQGMLFGDCTKNWTAPGGGGGSAELESLDGAQVGPVESVVVWPGAAPACSGACAAVQTDASGGLVVAVNHVAGVQAFDLALSLSAGVGVATVRKAELAAGCSLVWNVKEAEVQISLACATPVDGGGALLSVSVVGAADTAAVRVSKCVLDEGALPCAAR